jgi:putrescine transport system substrate-binding protein
VLNIYNWPDYMPEGMIAAFEKETGIKVNYDTFETNEALHAKLVAGNTGYDIVVPGTGVCQAADRRWHVPAAGQSQDQESGQPGSRHHVRTGQGRPGQQAPGAMGLGLHHRGHQQNQGRKSLGKMPMPENAWDLVFKPEYTSKLKSCGIAYLDSPTEIMPVALHYIGKDAYSNDAADYKAATEMLAKVRKDVRLFSSTMIDDHRRRQSLCGHRLVRRHQHCRWPRQGEQVQGRDRSAAAQSTGALIFFDTMAITKDAKHPNNACVHRLLPAC